MGVYSEMAADLRDNVQDRSPAIQDAAELASKRADDRQQAEEEQAKALLSQMQQNADDSPSPSNLKADKKAEEDRKRQEHEQAEAKRKAEWEARQRAKEEAEQAAWENAVAMSDDELMAASMQEIGVLSVHPCDFLEMSSKSNTWVSCHRLSDGGYQAGCLSYMNDRVSMVFYAVDADVSGEYRKAIRRYRQMFFYENGTLFQSRLYPADTGNALEVSKLFRHLVQQAISRCLTEPNLWYLKTKRPDLNAHLSTYRGSLHYPDYNYHGNLSVLQGHRKDTELTIGAAARCVCCGNELRSNGAIKCSCKEVAVCRKCGQTVARGQGIYLEDGFYCKTCLHICAACGRPSLGTMYPAYNRRGTLVEVCQDCYQQLTSGCASCSMASACRAMGHTLCEKATVAVA